MNSNLLQQLFGFSSVAEIPTQVFKLMFKFIMETYQALPLGPLVPSSVLDNGAYKLYLKLLYAIQFISSMTVLNT